MAFMVKSMVGGQLKNLTGGLGGDDKGEGEKSEAAAQGMTREEFEEYQRQLVEEKMERDANFAQKKAERATLRTHLRDKYKLPKVCALHFHLKIPTMQRELIQPIVKVSTQTERRQMSELDENQIQLAGSDVELPKELAKMIEEDNEEEVEKDSVLGQLTNIQNLDLDALKDKAQATLEDFKQTAEKCCIM